MKHRSEPLVWSDAWLLLAVFLASADGPADRGRITLAGDYINHAIFTADEWTRGIDRLRAREYVVDEDGRYRAGPSVVSSYAKACLGRCSLRTVLQRLEGFLKLGNGV